jgi:PAS domain S-box-containing protein
MLHPDDVMRFRDELRAVLHERDAATFECRVQHADGRWLQMRLIASNHTDDPYLGGRLITLTDITEERHAEIERETAAALHQFLADNSSDLMIRATSEGRIIYASSAAAPLLGVYPNDITGAPVLQLVEDEDRPRFEAALEEARHSGGVAMVDVRASLATAWRSVWLGVSCQYVIGLDNDREFQLSMRDISERVSGERRLADERRLLETTLASIQAGVLAVDADRTVVKVNAAYEEMMGFRPRPGESLVDFFERFQFSRPTAGSSASTSDRWHGRWRASR